MDALRDDGRRYEMDEAGLTSWAEYRRVGRILYIDHVETPPALRGTGAAGRLMEAVAQQAEAQALRVIPICSYAAAWLKRSAEFQHLVG